jgi:hypothetical protein
MFETATAPVSDLETAANGVMNLAPALLGVALLAVVVVAVAMFIAQKQQEAKYHFAVQTVRSTWPKLSHEKQAEKVMELMKGR